MIFVFTIFGCSSPKTKDEASSLILFKGLSGVDIKSGNIKLPIIGGNTPEIIHSKNECEGSAGSVLPPVALEGCTTGVFLLPFQLIEKVFQARDINEKHIMLSGIESFWVHQSEENDCWAAVFKMARDFLGYRKLSQIEILNIGKAKCPKIKDQENGADAYQILTIINDIYERYDSKNREPMFCTRVDCIVSALKNNHPIIMLRSGHVLLIVGADYIDGKAALIKTVYTLDPASINRKINSILGIEICAADLFLSY